MTKFENLSLIISVISTLFVLIGAIYAGIQLYLTRTSNKKIHEWNRRKTTYDLLKDFSNGDFPKLLIEMRRMSKLPIDENTNYEVVIDSFSDNDKYVFDKKLSQLLNYFEGISISIKNHIIDEDICFDYAAILFERYYNWSKGFIKKRRDTTDIRTIYINFESLAKKWIEVKKLDSKKQKEVLISKGKNKLY